MGPMLECAKECAACATEHGTTGLIVLAAYVGLNLFVAMRKQRSGVISDIVDSLAVAARHDEPGTVKLPIVRTILKKRAAKATPPQ